MLCVVGFLASLAAFGIGFVPSSQFGGGSVWSYVGIVAGGTVLLGLLIPWLFLRLRKPGWQDPRPRRRRRLSWHEPEHDGVAAPVDLRRLDRAAGGDGDRRPPHLLLAAPHQPGEPQGRPAQQGTGGGRLPDLPAG
ncbi:hypothetical protein ACFQZC_33615 [Streptacidiphilus monticola]